MKKIHFIGIGGIGISALARFMKEKGFEISGSDIKKSTITKQLENEGIKVQVPHGAQNVVGKDLVIYSAAIKPDNVEFKKAKSLKIPCLSRKEALPEILKDKKILAVAGAHGKSTTSSILACLINEASVIIGAILKDFGSNMIYKESDKLIFEADESDSSFLNANPHLAIVTNAEAEHLEHYKGDLKALHKAYADFLKAAKVRVINAEDAFLKTLKIDAVKLYPSKDIKNFNVRVENFKPRVSFELKNYGKFSILGMGYHLAIDASLAILAALKFKDVSDIRVNLLGYSGIKKRFDILVANENLAIVDDYGHHPTEIAATLEAAQDYARLVGYDKITAIFEPHRYTRLAANLEAFKAVFKGVDELVILPVYAAGEAEIKIDLAKHFKKAVFVKDIKRKGDTLVDDKNRVYDKGLIIGFGAGDISAKLRSAND